MAMKYVYPVLAPEEAEAAKVTLRAVLSKRLLVDHDADKVKGAIEAIEHAPVRDGHGVERAPGGSSRLNFAHKSETSRQAAIKNWPKRGKQRELVLLTIYRLGPVTRDELIDACRIPQGSVNGRCNELTTGEWIRPAVDEKGKPIRRDTRNKSGAECVEVTPRARAYIHAHPELFQHATSR